ncbi:leucine-rich repeat protein [Skeletonema marinoi]|uniref:Leucine-rich repeat protein n=1 Tax=Skeletonema marinoi TaxID=267567 RepID=A0AAD9D3B7_9STRA|nr:leucine-rich repeat protein [Skeletonema marinoi]
MMMYIEPVSEQRINVTTQVNIYLTGVPSNQNMTTTEQEVFESLFYTLLQSRLETVDVGILEVVVDAQINDPQFDADSPFDSSQSDTNNGGGETKLLSSVLQLVTNVTLTYSDPPPEGWRDWSIYLTSWIESFGPTMVDIFTDPKHKLYPNQEFFNTISDVSGTNVVPPNTDPTMSPTLAPTYLGAPEYKKPLVTGWQLRMAALALALNENTSISRLSLQSNMFTSEGVEYLIVCLVCNSTIDVVDLEGNSPIDPRILDELCGILQSRGVPNHSNKLELLLERIRGNDPNLTQLDLRGMGIGQEDNDAIMDALAGNAYLRKVDLSDNMIDDDGVSALSLALADNTSITHMCLAENRITSIGAEYLLCALDTNDTIVDVDLAGNSIDAGVMDELNHALKQRRTVDGY